MIDCTVVISDNSARRMISRHGGIRTALSDFPGLFIDTGNAAHFAVPDNLSGKAAVDNRPVVVTRDTSHLTLGAVRDYLSHNIQVAHRAALLNIPEQSGSRTGSRHPQIRYGIAASVKDSAKAGNGKLGILL